MFAGNLILLLISVEKQDLTSHIPCNMFVFQTHNFHASLQEIQSISPATKLVTYLLFSVSIIKSYTSQTHTLTHYNKELPTIARHITSTMKQTINR